MRCINSHQLRGRLRTVLQASKVDDPSVITYLRETQASLLETLQEALLRVERETNPSDAATVSAGDTTSYGG